MILEKNIAYVFKAFINNCFETIEGRLQKKTPVKDKEMQQLVAHFQGWDLLEKAARVFYNDLKDVKHFRRIPIRNYDLIIAYTELTGKYPVDTAMGLDANHPSTLSLLYPTIGWINTFDMRKTLRSEHHNARTTRSGNNAKSSSGPGNRQTNH